MKLEDRLKVKCIIKTLLLIQGPKTAKQLDVVIIDSKPQIYKIKVGGGNNL